jgi:hypothetical protein
MKRPPPSGMQIWRWARTLDDVLRERMLAAGAAVAPDLALPLMWIAWRWSVAPRHCLHVHELIGHGCALCLLIETARADFAPAIEHDQGPRFLRFNAEVHDVAA